MLPTWQARYAVVRDDVQKKFTKWHESKELAVAEAKRLCEAERVPFIVLREMGCASVIPTPVDFTDV